MTTDRAHDMRRVPNSAAPIVWQKDALSKEDHDLRNDAGYWYSKTGMTPDDVQEENSKEPQ